MQKVKQETSESKNGWKVKIAGLPGLRIFIVLVTILFILIFSLIAGFIAKGLCQYVFTKIKLSGGFFSGVGWIAGLILFFFLTHKLIRPFLEDTIREIPADPPHKGVLLFLQERTMEILDEGWRLFPFYQVLFGAIVIDISKNNEDLPPQEVKTPDLANLSFEVSITWSAGGCWDKGKKEQIKLLNNYIMSGKKPGVEKIYRDVIQSRLRAWVFAEDEGPASWQEAIGCRDEVIATLVKAILGDNIPTIPSDIPTNVLLRYFSVPRKGPLEYQKQKWGKQTEQGSNWEGIEAQLKEIVGSKLEALKKAIKERQDIIRTLREGNGSLVHKKLGITIHLLTINNVILVGPVAEAVQKRAKEKEERIAETTELDHVLEKVKKLSKEGKVPKELAVEMTQTERAKITKTVNESKISLSPELISLLKKFMKLLSPSSNSKSVTL